MKTQYNLWNKQGSLRKDWNLPISLGRDSSREISARERSTRQSAQDNWGACGISSKLCPANFIPWSSARKTDQSKTASRTHEPWDGGDISWSRVLFRWAKPAPTKWGAVHWTCCTSKHRAEVRIICIVSCWLKSSNIILSTLMAGKEGRILPMRTPN